MSLFNLSFIVLIATLLIILSPSFTNAHVLPRQEHPITTQKDIFCGTAYHAVPSHTTLMTLLQKTNNACRNFGALDPKSPINETNAISVKKVALNENTDCAVCIFWMNEKCENNIAAVANQPTSNQFDIPFAKSYKCL